MNVHPSAAAKDFVVKENLGDHKAFREGADYASKVVSHMVLFSTPQQVARRSWI
jgi:hypothetical protein